MRCCLEGKRPEVGQAHWGTWYPGRMVCYSLLEKSAFASFFGRIWICLPNRLKIKTIWVIFIEEMAVIFRALPPAGQAQPTQALMCFIQQHDSLIKKASH